MDLAAARGLNLDPWQQLFMEGAAAEVGDRWAAFEVAGVVARQNGKGVLLEARELAGIELFGERLVLHTAHELKTAEEAFLRMVTICESCPDLDRRVLRVSRVNGKEAIWFRGGARIKYVARSKRSGRGLTGDLVVFDEAMFLDVESMAALIPTLTTADNPQIWYMGSAGFDESTQLLNLRARAEAGSDPSLAYFEWSAADGAGLDDREAWAAANPALGVHTTEWFVERERLALSDEEFARERLGIWGGAGRTGPIDPDRWRQLVERRSRPGSTVAFGVDVPPDRKSASIAVAGVRADGKVHVEMVPCCRLHGRGGGRCAGTGWAPGRLVELDRKWKPNGVLLDPAAPAGSLIVELSKQKVEPVLITGREMAQACGAFVDLVADENDPIRHLGQAELNVAVDGARKRNLSDAWAWHRRDATVDISPLVAATLAVHGLGKKPRRRRSGRVTAV